MRRIYVAGAYSSDNVIGLLDNIRKGQRWGAEVFLRGYAPFCPWNDLHFQLQLPDGAKLTVQDYYDYSMAFLEASEAVFVTPGWEGSKGTIAEIARAEELGIPVVYNIDDLDGLFK